MNTLAVLRGIIRIGIAVIILGILFRMMRWIGGIELLIIGSISVFLAYGIRFFLQTNRSALAIIQWTLIEMVLLRIILLYLNLPGQIIANYSMLVLFVAWLIMGGPAAIYRRKSSGKTSFIHRYFFWFIFLFFLLILIGSLFKIMHWSSADTLLIVGMSGLALLFLLNSIRQS